MTKRKRQIDSARAPHQALTESQYGSDSHGATAIFENRSENELLDSEEAATFLRITRNALRIMVCRGKIEPQWLGGRYRFRRDDLRLALSSTRGRQRK